MTQLDAANPQPDENPLTSEKDPLEQRPVSDRWWFVRSLWKFFAIFVLALFVFSQFGKVFFLAELLSNFRVQMILLTLVTALICWRPGRQSRMALMLLAATLWNAVLVGLIFVPGNQPPPGPKKIKIMSFNVYAAAHDHQAVLELIAAEAPDVLVVLEYDGRWFYGLEPLENDYPYRFPAPRWHGFGIGIFSKIPLKNSRIEQLISKKTDAPMLVTEVDLGDQTLRIAGIHVLSPTDRMRMDLRNQQFQEIADSLSQAEIPTIALGDFNCAPWSAYLQDFVNQTGYRDSRQGFGYHATWHKTFWPMLTPIDNAFVSKDVHVHNRYVAAGTDSDHYPIVLELSVSK